MLHSLFLLSLLASASFAARPTDYSTDLVMLQGNQVIQVLKLYVSGLKTRVEGLNAGPLGRIVTIGRKDNGVTYTLYPDKLQYTEQSTPANSAKPDLTNFDHAGKKKENLGHETVLGHTCTKMRVVMGNLPNGQPLSATVWVADSLDLPLRLETMGFVQENRNLKVAPQPASLFEIPNGYTKTNAPGKPPRFPTQASPTGFPRAWQTNANYPGGDFRSIDMATADPTRCKAACDTDSRCLAWTLVKPTEPGGMGYCWLKDSVPPIASDDCCISGLKRVGPPDAPTTTYAMELNINRYGEDYRDFIPAKASATLCAEACDKQPRCRAWTWVKHTLEPPTGHCWLKDRIPEPTADDCCTSGVKR